MAYSNPSAPATTSALLSAVSTFAVAQGWTEDNYDGTNKKMSLHKGTCYVHFWWNDEHTDTTNYPVSVAMYQSLGYISAGTDPWAHTDDSGIGREDSSSPYELQYERGIKYIGPGPYTSLHLFAHTNPDVIYCVLEYSPGLYRHFAFGTIDRVPGASWTGGEFVAGHHWAYSNGGAYKHYMDNSYHSVLMDGNNYTWQYSQDIRSFATMHCEGLPDQSTLGTWNQKFGAVTRMDQRDEIKTVDRDGLKMPHICGSMRDGIVIQQFGWLLPNLAQGFIPIIPCDIWYRSEKGTIDDFYYLGRLPHMGTVSLYGIDPQQIVTIGTDDWMAFPTVRKSNTQTTGVEESRNMGIIYKK